MFPVKKFLFVLAISGFNNISFAQDVIMLKNGDEINAKVIEIGISEIKYKKFEAQGDTLVVIPKTNVFMIKYENGTKDVINKISKPKSSSQKKSNDALSSGVLYGGVSSPVGDFGSSDVKIGFAGGVEGLISVDKSVFFNFDIGYTYSPISNYTKYNTISGLIGMRVQGVSPRAKMYVFIKGGAAQTFGGNNSGAGIAYSPGFGVIINENFNIGAKYLYAKRSFSRNGVMVVQLVIGYVF